MTEAYELVKNLQFRNGIYSIQASIKKRLLSNSNLEAIINCTNFVIAPTADALLQEAQPTSTTVERSFSTPRKY